MTIKRPANDYPPGEEPGNSIINDPQPRKRFESREMQALRMIPVENQLVFIMEAFLNHERVGKAGLFIPRKRIEKAFNSKLKLFTQTTNDGIKITLEEDDR